MLENELIIREPKISLLRRIMFSIAFGLFFLIVMSAYNLTLIYSFSFGDKIQIISYLLFLFFVFLMSIGPFISRHIIHLKFRELKIRHSFAIGMWNYNEKWQDLEGFDYISVFKVREGFQVNLWYHDKSILNLFVIKNFEEAIENAYQISIKLNIELLDASVKGNHRWINLIAYAETSEITYL